MLQAQAQCVYNIGVDASTAGTSQSTQLAYNLTFVHYLNTQLASTGCTFTMTLYSDPDTYRAAAINGEVDIFFSGPGVFACLQVCAYALICMGEKVVSAVHSCRMACSSSWFHFLMQQMHRV